ncbi:hypothetical protein PENTCL1PPCAC_17605 [Pristionchus entomophagus]|uniref:Condensin complex subunit 1 C-terminal domain-containing protein n=1 Tax=Pristionchus entomophagus TaxID=358040 RepID=A0AAV5TMB9_9BILA|nr:hypothetical protein PENTCL1PPCAC_17605 [Pristionchus entomophagus]
MDTLSFLLEESLEKGHRRLLETTWLKAVLPLINDRENAVQAMTASLVEEHLIHPIMRSYTPDACWDMLKRVEEEVSNRRLLVRTLAFLSTQEVKKMKNTVVDTLNHKLISDPAHSNVIWMLLADLSTVFGDKIDPRNAVRTWYALPDNETANTMSYVAKVVGEGSKKLKDDERDRVAQDMENKLFEYRVHGPHISTVYLALARLMDAVGELASGKDVLERFGRRLLDEGSRIIYTELDMFTEKEEDEQEVAKEDEIRVIRIVITIGEVIQLSPSLIDSANKLFEGLQLIMSSELYLSEAFQLRRQMNSAIPSATNSRAPSAMGHHEPVSTQESDKTLMVNCETGNAGTQQTVIPSQVQQQVKTTSLRKALFTATVRRCALTTIGKFCLMDEAIAKACIATFIRQLKFNPDHIIRNNIVIVLCDLCIRYTLLVDKYTPIIASCLKDSAILVRQQTLECLTILIKEAFIRWEGQLMYRFVATILDDNGPIREYSMFCLKDVLLPQNPCMFFNHFIECLLYFNDVPRKYKMASTDSSGDIDKAIKFTLSGTENEAARIKLYEFMLDTFDDKQKFITMAKMCEEIFTAVYSEEMRIEDERVVALLTDAFKVISCEQMQLKLDVGKKGDEEEEEQPAPQVVQEAAKSMITAVFRTAIITSIMPHVLELRRYLIEKRHPIMKYMMGVLRALTKSHMDQLQEFFAGDRIALREIEYDIKRLNNLEKKLKLKAAAQAAEKEAEKALVPSSRRECGVNEGEKGGEAVEREVPIHPNQVVMRDGIEGDETGHIEEPIETSSVKEKEQENEEGLDVEMEMDEPAPIPNGEENEDEVMEEEKEEGGEEEREEVAEEGGEMEIEEIEDGDNGKTGEEDDDGEEKENEQVEGVSIVEEEEEIEEVEEVAKDKMKKKKEKKNKDNDKNEKTPAEKGEAEIKEEPIEVEEEGNKENDKEERRKKRKEKRKENAIEEKEIKEEPLDEEEERENRFAVPTMLIRGKKLPTRSTRAESEFSISNETLVEGGYGQSTPRKGTPIGDDGDGSEEREDIPHFPDLDISAIAPRPRNILKTKSKISQAPKTGTIGE